MWNILTRPGFHCCCWEIQCNSDFPTVSYIWFSSLHPKIFFFFIPGSLKFPVDVTCYGYFHFLSMIPSDLFLLWNSVLRFWPCCSISLENNFSLFSLLEDLSSLMLIFLDQTSIFSSFLLLSFSSLLWDTELFSFQKLFLTSKYTFLCYIIQLFWYSNHVSSMQYFILLSKISIIGSFFL